jgi:hypothetical protein
MVHKNILLLQDKLCQEQTCAPKERTQYSGNGTLQQLELYVIAFPKMYFNHFGQHLTSSYFS